MIKPLIIFLTSIFLPGTLMASELTEISQEDFIARQNDNNFVLLDVRTAEEYAKGHIKGALNISHTEILENIDKLSKDKEIILYCRSGKRAGIAAGKLIESGFTKLLHLDGDMNGWLANALPVEVVEANN